MPVPDQRLYRGDALLSDNHGWKRLGRQEAQQRVRHDFPDRCAIVAASTPTRVTAFGFEEPLSGAGAKATSTNAISLSK